MFSGPCRFSFDLNDAFAPYGLRDLGCFWVNDLGAVIEYWK